MNFICLAFFHIFVFSQLWRMRFWSSLLWLSWVESLIGKNSKEIHIWIFKSKLFIQNSLSFIHHYYSPDHLKFYIITIFVKIKNSNFNTIFQNLTFFRLIPNSEQQSKFQKILQNKKDEENIRNDGGSGFDTPRGKNQNVEFNILIFKSIVYFISNLINISKIKGGSKHWNRNRSIPAREKRQRPCQRYTGRKHRGDF